MGSGNRRQVQLRVGARHDRIRFEVEDTGPGLPPELVSHAFDPYVRGAGTSEPGLGLGLATVRRLVEGHDGRYGVSSRPGEGALFWFELPAAEPTPPELPPLPEAEQRQHAN
jgi:signal transduction histidine kinase